MACSVEVPLLPPRRLLGNSENCPTAQLIRVAMTDSRTLPVALSRAMSL